MVPGNVCAEACQLLACSLVYFGATLKRGWRKKRSVCAHLRVVVPDFDRSMTDMATSEWCMADGESRLAASSAWWSYDRLPSGAILRNQSLEPRTRSEYRASKAGSIWAGSDRGSWALLWNVAV